MKPSRSSILVLLFILGLVFSACSPATQTESPTNSEIPTLDNQPLPETSATVEVRPTSELPSGQENLPTAAPPPVKTALEATDPRNVDLASGTPTLVEFFAFW